MERPRPACPTCGTTDERPPDALGVHRCPVCAIEFRPPLRMPIRRAAVATTSNGEAGQWAFSLVLVGVLVGLAMAFGDYQAAQPAPIDIEPIRPLVIDPALFEGLEHVQVLELPAPLATISLEHEIHTKQLTEGELFATGVIVASEAVEELSLQADCRDRSGAPLGVLHAVLSCKRMQAGERCAWMIDSEVPGSIAELELAASGRRSLGIGPPQLDLRSDRPGELDFNPNKRTVKFVTRDHTLSEAWATVTAYSPEGRVLGVAETRFGGRHKPGRQRFQVELPKPPDEVASYAVRLGGQLSDW